ncbi:protein PIN-LIKES 3-like isoform X2 [Hibiscus syriacus]|uniref:protein PIN-LIKES 3-like isoform X2 n=1 Tax=Hibiscus syriacus TaxID=106335 RepID=UPI0019246CC4|nr:protein PIN-LIKES 3-like isoform X2 [Hibiscus syriacus]
MGFVDLFVVALMPVVEILLVTAVGLFLSIEKISLLGPQASNYMNKIVFYLLNPCLLVSNLAKAITYKSLVTLWFMPLNVLLTFLIGSALGWILIKITKTPKHLRGTLIGCCSTGNLGNFPLIVIPALCEESDSPFSRASTCSTNAQAYASLSMAITAIYTWSYTYLLMSSYAVTTTDQTSIQSSEQASDSCTEPLLMPSYSDGSEKLELPLTDVQGMEKVSLMEKIVHCVKKMLVPSAIGAIIGLIIGGVSPIRNVLIGNDAPLRVVDSSAALIGQAAVPVMTLIMGANLLEGLKSSKMNVSAILGVIAVRNVCLPLSGIGVVKAAEKFGIVGSDSLYHFVLMFQYAVPPAINVQSHNYSTVVKLKHPSFCSGLMLSLPSL